MKTIIISPNQPRGGTQTKNETIIIAPSQPRGGTQTKNKTIRPLASQGVAREQKTKQSEEQAIDELKNNRQNIATYGSDDTTGAPLTVKVMATTGRLETLEENRKVTLQASPHFGDDVHSAWGNITKTEIILGLPDVEFTQVQKVDKDANGQ